MAGKPLIRQVIQCFPGNAAHHSEAGGQGKRPRDLGDRGPGFEKNAGIIGIDLFLYLVLFSKYF
jgi:hypothetical protein